MTVIMQESLLSDDQPAMVDITTNTDHQESIEGDSNNARESLLSDDQPAMVDITTNTDHQESIEDYDESSSEAVCDYTEVSSDVHVSICTCAYWYWSIIVCDSDFGISYMRSKNNLRIARYNAYLKGGGQMLSSLSSPPPK